LHVFWFILVSLRLDDLGKLALHGHDPLRSGSSFSRNMQHSARVTAISAAIKTRKLASSIANLFASLKLK
jgi:hypothetical protein